MDLKKLAESAITALSMHMTKRAGGYGKVDLAAEEIGRMAAMTTDIKETTAQFANGKIKREEAKVAYKNAILKGFMTYITPENIDMGGKLITQIFPKLGESVKRGVDIIKSALPLIKSFTAKVFSEKVRA